MRSSTLAAAGMAVAAAGLACFLGCEPQSASDVQRNVGVNFTGYFVGRDNGAAPLVAKNSGASIKTMDLRQSGDRLEGIDSNGAVWKGSLGDVIDGITSFILEGHTTAGAQGTFSGTLSAAGVSAGSTNSGPTTGTMTGTYVEPTFYSTFYGTATIPGQISSGNSGGGSGLSISPNNPTVPVGGQTTFTVSGGTAPYQVSLSPSGLGTLSGSTTDRSVTFYRTSAGNVTFTVTDSTSKSASTTIR